MNQRLAWLKRSLTVHRLAFGQPPQNDLLGFLRNLPAAFATPGRLDAPRIRLEPTGVDQEAGGGGEQIAWAAL
jgi:hypothetical protein